MTDQYVSHFTSYVSTEGTKTNTPELKQSGHPGSGDAENSSRWNNSSQFCTTWIVFETNVIVSIIWCLPNYQYSKAQVKKRYNLD